MQTAVYSRIDELEIKVDFQAPPFPKQGILPGIIFLHGGGMVSGYRQEYFDWMIESVHRRGMIFFSADYRLIHPSTGFDIIEDMRTLFAFLSDPSFSTTYLPDGISLDPTRVAVMGSSGGGYAAMAAALYAQPKPQAVYLLYAMGGNFLCDHWISAKDSKARMGLHGLPDEKAAGGLLDKSQNPVSECPLKPRPGGAFGDEGGRMSLFPYWWRTGKLLDHVLGEPVSARLRALAASERLAAVPTHLLPALLQVHIDESFPPTFLLHGGSDMAVPLAESKTTYDRLRDLGVTVELEVVPNGPHGLMTCLHPLKLAAGAEEAQEKGMDFLARWLLGQGSDSDCIAADHVVTSQM